MNNEKQPLLNKRPKLLRYKVYIAGKVTGLPYKETFQKFLAIEEMLKMLGQEVVNPMRIVPQGSDWESAMRLCIPALYGCNAFYTLPDWKESRGATIEYFNANAMGFTRINDAMISEIRHRLRAIENHFPKLQD